MIWSLTVFHYLAFHMQIGFRFKNGAVLVWPVLFALNPQISGLNWNLIANATVDRIDCRYYVWSLIVSNDSILSQSLELSLN